MWSIPSIEGREVSRWRYPRGTEGWCERQKQRFSTSKYKCLKCKALEGVSRVRQRIRAHLTRNMVRPTYPQWKPVRILRTVYKSAATSLPQMSIHSPNLKKVYLQSTPHFWTLTYISNCLLSISICMTNWNLETNMPPQIAYLKWKSYSLPLHLVFFLLFLSQ